MVRRCRACGRELPLDAFHDHSLRRCKECVASSKSEQRYARISAARWAQDRPQPAFDAEADRQDEVADLNALWLGWHFGREPNLDAVLSG